MIENPDIAQFKLVNGNEVVCEVVEWSNDNQPDMIVRNAMQVVGGYDAETDETFFIFRPWCSFVESHSELIVLNSAHILSTNKVNRGLFIEWSQAVISMHKNALDRQHQFAREDARMQAHLEKTLMEMSEEKTSVDAGVSTTNVLSFPNKDTETIH
tara:strand:- start:19746 stop:20213 length:468 start_codon:yes stop_codon:yes gene_type:complete